MHLDITPYLTTFSPYQTGLYLDAQQATCGCKNSGIHLSYAWHWCMGAWSESAEESVSMQGTLAMRELTDENAAVQVRIIVSGTGDWRYMDCVSIRGGKLEALERVRTLFSVPRDRCVAAGDSGNDILMLEGAPARKKPPRATLQPSPNILLKCSQCVCLCQEHPATHLRRQVCRPWVGVLDTSAWSLLLRYCYGHWMPKTPSQVVNAQSKIWDFRYCNGCVGAEDRVMCMQEQIQQLWSGMRSLRLWTGWWRSLRMTG